MSAVPPERLAAFRQLAAAGDDVAERSRRFAELATAGGRLLLGGDARDHAVLAGIAAPRARLRRADLRYADLRGADLTRAFLAQACLRHVGLDGVRLAGADLSHADCVGAGMGEADLADALLEEADLSDTSLRFANLRRAALEGAAVRGADLWGADLSGADLRGADLTGAVVREAKAPGASFRGAVLAGASLIDSDFTSADFHGADLAGADLRGATLRAADLSDARLQGVDLSSCALAGARWHLARLDRTVLSREQLGPAVGEELAGEHPAAAGAYMALERNFLDLGDVDAASWAYRRKRRMQKRAGGDRAVVHWRARRPGAALVEGVNWCGAAIVEWTCDYGESVGRVFGSLFALFLLFIPIYWATGSVVRVDGDEPVPTSRLIDLALFSLGTMTSNAGASGTLLPAHSYTVFLAGLEATASIFLMGLLGFVAGNRIRR